MNGILHPSSPDPKSGEHLFTGRYLQLRAIYWSLFLLFLATGIIALLALFLFSGSSDSVERVEVISVYNIEEAEAITELQDLGLTVTVERAINVQIPKGFVYEQDPRPGAKLVSGDEVKIFISEGGELRAIPEIIGQDVVDAERILNSEEYGFETQIEYVSNIELPGVVIRQEPVAGTARLPGETIVLYVSLGITDRVPDVRDFPVNRAIALLESMDYIVAVDRIPHLEVLQDVVINTRPIAGTPAPEPRQITLIVSSGQLRETIQVMPSVVGLDESVARSELEQIGARISVVYRSARVGEMSGIVVDQFPVAGSEVLFGVSAEITVISGG